jgi:aspartyl aminopeptidase
MQSIGGLWHTWLDRDLGISGRVLVRENGTVTQKFVKIHKPIARVSSLCIHLKTAEERKSLNVNKETHLVPILGTAGILMDGVKTQLTGFRDGEEKDFWRDHHDPLLLNLIAKELGVEVKDIADFELNLFDTQPACLGGMMDEFLYSARLDNQATCFVSIEGLIAHTNGDAFDKDCDISMVCLFDHEEVGSSK